VIERSIDDITTKLLTPAPLEEDEKPAADEAEGEAEEARADTPADTRDAANNSKNTKGAAEVTAEGEEEAEEEQKEEWSADVVENDYLEKAAMKPPKDPEGVDTLHPDLILTTETLIEILMKAINIT